MSEVIKIILPSGITAIVTILGFIISYRLNSRRVKEEILKYKASKTLDKLEDMPRRILSLIDSIRRSQNSVIALQEEYLDILNQVFCYGSHDAVRIASTMQQYIYSLHEGKNNNRVVAYYVLLICQIRYDLSGEIISPNEWYRMRMSEYENDSLRLKEMNNDIVKQLQLNKAFRCL